MRGTGRKRGKRQGGAVLLLALTFLSVSCLLLAGLASLAQARRDRSRKLLLRAVMAGESRALELAFSEAVLKQVRESGALESAVLEIAAPGALLAREGHAHRPFLRTQRLSDAGAARAVAVAEQRDALPSGPSERLQLLVDWRANGTVAPVTDAASGTQNAIVATLREVRLSCLNYYSSARTTVLDGRHPHLGRAGFEGDVAVCSAIDARHSARVAGSVRMEPEGTWLVRRNPGGRFLGKTVAVMLGTEQSPLREPFLLAPPRECLVRPVSTGELFSTMPLGSPHRERHRLKPQCVLQVCHAVDADGNAVFTFRWAGQSAPSFDVSRVFRDAGDAVEIDLAQWPPNVPWAESIWVESLVPGQCVRVIHAEALRGNWSLATPQELQVSGSLNTGSLKRAVSLLTAKRVVCLP